jgi:surface carbohydrate biosynthesis protein
MPKLRFESPKPASVLVFDRQSETGLLPLLAETDFATVDTRGSDLNLNVLIRAMLTGAFWRGERQLAYVLAYAHAVKPSMLITFIDNNTAFLDLCDRLPEATSVAIQNGHRNSVSHLSSAKKRNLDFYFTFNAEYGSMAESHITGKSIALGSLRNNFVPISAIDAKSDRRVIFISQYFDRQNDFSYTSQDETTHSWDEFFAIERLALPELARWCALKGLTLEIKSRYRAESPTETAFYKSLYGLGAVEMIHSTSERESYELLDSGAMFVTIDSTLGYEALARGARVAFVSARDAQLGGDNREFGWPASLDRTGAYWLSDYTEQEMQSLLERVILSSEPSQAQRKAMIEFNAGNTKLASLLSEYSKN